MSDFNEKLAQFNGLKLRTASLTDGVLTFEFELDDDPNTDNVTRLVVNMFDAEKDILCDP